MWRVVYSVALGVCLGRVARTDEGIAVKQQVEDIFRTVERIMAQNAKPANPDSKTLEATVKEKIFVDPRDGEHENVDQLQMSPGVLSPTTFPIGIVMADNLYPLVVGKNVDSGKPFVINLNKQHALVVARAAPGGDYKLLIPFPVMVGRHPVPMDGDDHGGLTSSHHLPPVRGSYLVNTPSNLRSYDHSEEVATRPREHSHQSYRQHSGEEPESGEYLPTPTGKHILNPRPYNLKYRPEKVFYSHVNKPSGIRGHNDVYSKQGFSHGPKLNVPLKSVPLAYRQPPPGLYQYASPASRYPYPTHPPAAAHRPPLYLPVNYAGAYASVPKDFRPSPYLGNITDDPEPPRRPQPQSHSDHDESYDERPYDFTEQDYVDSLNSPGAHSSIAGVHHVTHHVDDYLGKIYEDMYYKMPPPHPHVTSNIDRKGNSEMPSAGTDMKVTAFHDLNQTEASRAKTDTTDNHQQVRPISRSTSNKPNKVNR